MIEEVKKNNFKKIGALFDPYVIGKINSGTVTGRVSQQRKRNIKNSFMTGQHRAQSGVHRSASKITDETQPSEYPNAIGPKK